MSADALAPLAAVQAPQAPILAGALPGTAPAPASAGPSVDFGQLVSQGLQGVNQSLLVSESDLQQLATGSAQNLHQIMIRLEESRLSFQMLMQVRNRLLEAYQDVMKMQV